MATYGIDLGTTYSCIFTIDQNGNPKLIKNMDENSDTLASAVYFESPTSIVVGENAKASAEEEPDRVVQFIKREIGKPEGFTRNFDGKDYSPTEISSLILKQLKAYAEAQGEEVRDVVITVPAYFGLEERNATREAGILAGLNVLNLINEPTAAALSYCARQFQEEKTVLVYDLGGGTFDVTLVKMEMVPNEHGEEVQRVKVIATGGNDLLGGKDWDDALYEKIVQACYDEYGISADDLSPETKQMIRSKVETAKKKLSHTQNTRVAVNVNDEGIIRVPITREDFEAMTSDKVAQTMNYVEDVLNKAGNPEIDTVLLVGGSTFMPMIREAVHNRFPGKVQLEDPNLAVAKGAALFANMLVEDIQELIDKKIISGELDSDTTFEDFAKKVEEETVSQGGQFSYSSLANALGTKPPIDETTSTSFGPGILSQDDQYVIDNIIKMGETIPATVTKTYYTVADNQKMVVLSAYEDRSMADTVIPKEDSEGNPLAYNPADQAKLLGQAQMFLPPNTKRGTPIEVTFVVETMGLYMRAINLDTGETVEANIKFNSDIDMDNSAVHSVDVSSGEL